MISDWETKKFGDCAFLVKEIINPTEAPSTYYVGLEHIGESSLSLLSFGESESVESSKYKFKKGDILFGKLRPYFRKVVIAPFDGICSTDIWVVRAKDGIDQNFLFYWMASNKFVDAASRGSEGTRMPRAKWDFVSQLEELIPSYKEQKCIANLLSSLSKKIEHNNCQNEMLDKIARAIFKSWFIDFDPVRAKAEGKQPFGMDEETAALFPSEFEDSELGEIPKGWQVKPLDNIASFLNGLALQKYPAEADEYLPVIKIAELRKGITASSGKASLDVPPDYIINDGDVIFSWSGSLECVIWCGGRGALNQHLFKVTSRDHPKWFYYHWVHHHLPEFRAIAAGKATTMGHIQRGHLHDALVVVPPSHLMEHAEGVFTPLIEKFILNRLESHNLASIRDMLLPKLLSGEIRVPVEAD